MNYSLLPIPKIVPIPEQLEIKLNKLKEKLEKKAKQKESMVFGDFKFDKKISMPKESAGRIDAFYTELNNCEYAELKETTILKKPKKLEKTFRELLFEMIDKRGLSDSEVYNKAFIDRRLFSKIRTNDDYHPKKGTVLQLCFALELSIKETLALLKSADYYLTRNSDENVIMYYMIENKMYNLVEANNYLFSKCGKTIDQL